MKSHNEKMSHLTVLPQHARSFVRSHFLTVKKGGSDSLLHFLNLFSYIFILFYKVGLKKKDIFLDIKQIVKQKARYKRFVVAS